MELFTKTEEQVCIISVQDTRIDAAVALEFKDSMRARTDSANDVVILDLSRVEFIDSSGLGAIVAAKKNMGTTRQLVLAGLTPNVAKVFALTRMDTVFGIFETLDDAIKELCQ